MFDYREKIKTRIYKQYKDSPKLIQWLLILPDIAKSNIVDQLAKIRAILDIDNATGDQLDICGRIAGYLKRPVMTLYPACTEGEVDDDIFRILIKAKIFKNNSIATIDEIKEAADYILGVSVNVLDGQDMTMRLAWEDDVVSVAVQQMLGEHNLIPRPQGVRQRDHRVVKYKPFGFGPSNRNFNNAPFWGGDGLHFNYSAKITLSFDLKTSELKGVLNSNNDDVIVSGIDVVVKIQCDSGGFRYVNTITDQDGLFSVSIIERDLITIIAKAQVLSPGCTTINVESSIFIDTAGNPEPEQWHLACRLTIGQHTSTTQYDYGFYEQWGIGSVSDVETDLYTGDSAVVSTINGYTRRDSASSGFLFRISDAATGNYIRFLSDNPDAKLTVWLNGEAFYCGSYSSISNYKNYVWNKDDAPALQAKWFNQDYVGETVDVLLQFSLN